MSLGSSRYNVFALLLRPLRNMENQPIKNTFQSKTSCPKFLLCSEDPMRMNFGIKENDYF